MEVTKDVSFANKVIVIGAGIAGIACADVLLKSNLDVTILEANDYYGGRLKSLSGFADFDIELGGEEIHGENSEYYRCAEKSGAKIFGYWSENLIYTNFRGEICSIENTEIQEVRQIEDIFEDISYEFNKDYEDETLKEYMIKCNIHEDVYHIGNAMIGVEAGTDLNKISMQGFSNVCKSWKSGEENYLLRNKAHIDVVNVSFPEAVKKIKLNTPITRIDSSSPDMIVLTDTHGNTHVANRCVITVPITQLKPGKISFTPELSEEKKVAISKINMDSTAKVIMKFKKPFWPENTCWLLFKGHVNCFWPTGQGKETNDCVLTGMVTGESCDNLRNLYIDDKEKFISIILQELEEGIRVTALRENLIDFYWFDWSVTPFIEGGYTYPGVGEGETTREIVRKPIDNRIFFGGEAFAGNGHIATIHGALETGLQAAQEVLGSLQSN